LNFNLKSLDRFQITLFWDGRDAPQSINPREHSELPRSHDARWDVDESTLTADVMHMYPEVIEIARLGCNKKLVLRGRG
jgi:hypothetical protein